MSIQALSWALEFQDLPLDKRTGKPSSSCAFVLIGLANHASREGTDCFPSVETLQRYTKLSERAVQYALTALEAHGTIRETPNPLVRNALISDTRARPKSYDIAAFPDCPVATYPRGAKSPKRVAKGCKVIDPGVQTPDLGGAKSGGEFAPEPSLDPSPLEPSSEPCVLTGEVSPDRAQDDNTHAPPQPQDRPVKERPRGRRPMGPHTPSPDELNATARRPGAQSIVNWWRSTHDTPARYGTYRDVAKKVDQLLADGAQPDLIKVALRDWDNRGRTVAFLENCYDDAVKATRPLHVRTAVDNRPSTADAAASRVDDVVDGMLARAMAGDQLAVGGGW